ncbi:acyl carrier protein [Mucilaginibacter sp. 21P]|uniref:acyl carrier protein n=1 Tax=Mucilaginibacter sp. 21P TaxID=2778902 RepID=UPI001C5A27B2|nr:acyl carrier protein [Mucilaginibacter sp. 21P]QXV63894.1 acyl carrier protein [Mucilaginibacter sp. 21P]
MEDLRIENPPAKARIREFIKKNIGSASISDDQDLFDSGIVNSLFSIQLVTFVEKNFNITVTVDDLDIENFKSVNAVFDFLQVKTSGNV